MKTMLRSLVLIFTMFVITSCFGQFFGLNRNYDLIPPVEDGCYGYLYNNYVVGDTRELTSSDDWYVAPFDTLNDLSLYLGGNSVSGGKLKEIGIDTWNSPNTGATNEVGYTARGGGYRTNSGSFQYLGIYYIEWLSSGNTDTSRDYFYLSYNNDNLAPYATYPEYGMSIRLVKDATGISDGTQTTYTGNDGKIYPAIAINGKYWLQQNLEETQYRNGDPIYNIEDNTTWAGLTEGALCLYDNNEAYACKTPLPQKPCYGYLYNWYVVDDSREITSSADWSVPTGNQQNNLANYVGGYSLAGKLKATEIAFWDTPNTGAENHLGFRMIGGGARSSATGVFQNMKVSGYFWNTNFAGDNGGAMVFNSTSVSTAFGPPNKKTGISIRLVKTTTDPDGTTTTYTGNDGKVYNAVAINGLYWTTENLEETKYRDGTPIPNVTDNTAWSNLTTGAWCVYENNDEYRCK